MKLEHAVEILATSRPSRYLFEREFAAAVFSGWINSPADPQAPTTTLFAALNRAILREKGAGRATPGEWLDEVFEPAAYLHLLEEAFGLPHFWHLAEHTGYNNCRYAGDLIRFLLTFRSKEEREDRRKRASLGKAWEFINKHGGFVGGRFGFERKAWCSLSGHQLIWRKYKRSAPFQCARFNGSKLDWYLDPTKPDFLDRLILVATDVEGVSAFFRRSLDVQQRLRKIADQRAISESDYLILPGSLIAAPCKLPALSGSAYGKMASYRRTAPNPNWE